MEQNLQSLRLVEKSGVYSLAPICSCFLINDSLHYFFSPHSPQRILPIKLLVLMERLVRGDVYIFIAYALPLLDCSYIQKNIFLQADHPHNPSSHAFGLPTTPQTFSFLGGGDTPKDNNPGGFSFCAKEGANALVDSSASNSPMSSLPMPTAVSPHRTAFVFGKSLHGGDGEKDGTPFLFGAKPFASAVSPAVTSPPGAAAAATAPVPSFVFGGGLQSSTSDRVGTAPAPFVFGASPMQPLSSVSHGQSAASSEKAMEVGTSGVLFLGLPSEGGVAASVNARPTSPRHHHTHNHAHGVRRSKFVAAVTNKPFMEEQSGTEICGDLRVFFFTFPVSLLYLHV